MKRVVRLVAVLGVLASLSTACGGGSSSGGTSSESTIRYAAASIPKGLDPLLVPGTLPTFGYAVFDGLLSEPQMEQTQPGLAESREIDEATKTVTLHLRSGVTFHDGTPFNAAAVKANFDRGKTLEATPYRALYGSITAVDTPDDRTAVIRFTTIPPDIELQLARAPGFMMSPASLTSPDLDRHPVGTGPYVFDVAASRAGEKLVFTRNPSYWAPELQKVERVEYYTYERAALLNVIQTGGVDVAWGLQGADVAALKSEGMNIVPGPQISPSVLWIPDHAGKVVPALGDPRVRKAMALTVDAQGFRDGPQQGHGFIASQFAPDASWAHFPDLERPHEVNIAEAKQLLASAGYPNGFSCKGVVGMGTVTQQWTQTVARSLAEIGVTMELDQANGSEYLIKARNGDYTCLAMTLTWTGDPASHLDSFASAPGIVSRFGPLPSEMTELAAQGVATIDPALRAPVYNELYRKLFDSGIVTVFLSADNTAFISPEVRGAWPLGLGGSPANPRGVTKDAS